MSFFSSTSSSRKASADFSSSSSKSLSTASHRVKRHLISSALISARQSLGTGIVDLSTHDGTVYDHVKAELGKALYDKLRRDSGLTLVTINYCARALQEGDDDNGIQQAQVAKVTGESNVSEDEVEKVKQVMGYVNHEYLVLELRPGPDSTIAVEMQRKSLNRGSIFILAEKLGGKGQVGVHINHVKDEDVDLRNHDGVKVFAIDCEKSKIPLKTILKILGNTVSADYNLKDQNCWDYATAVTKRLLLECVQVNDSRVKPTLQEEHDGLEAKLNVEKFINTFRQLIQ